MSVTNQVSEPILLQWKLGNELSQLEVGADKVKRESRCVMGLNPSSPLKLIGVTKNSRTALLINGHKAAVVVPTTYPIDVALYVTKGNCIIHVLIRIPYLLIYVIHDRVE